MSYVEHGFKSGDKLYASQLNEMDAAIGTATKVSDVLYRDLPNLYDKGSSENGTGYYIDSTLRSAADNNFWHSHKIRVEGGVLYKMMCPDYGNFGGNAVIITMWREDGSYIGIVRGVFTDDTHKTMTALFPNDCYIICNIAPKNKADYVIAKASEYAEDAAFGKGVTVKIGDTDFFKTETSANLFDKNARAFTTDAMIAFSGSTVPMTGACCWLIPIKEAGIYVYNSFPEILGGGASAIAYFDADQNYIAARYGAFVLPNVQNTSAFRGTPCRVEITQAAMNNGLKYIGFNVIKEYFDKAMFVKANDLPENYIPYYTRNTIEGLVVSLDNVTGGSASTGAVANPLYLKTAVFDGDSICADGGSGTGGWAKRIMKNASMASCQNYGIGGGTISYVSSDRHCLSRYVDTIHERNAKIDYFIFDGGTNDADLSFANIGTLNATDFSGNYDDTTFTGAFEALIYKVLNYWRGVRIGYIVAQKMGAGSEYANRRIFFDRAVEICKKWGVPYIDLWNGSPLNPALSVHYDSTQDANANEADGHLYRDGQHLTANGYDVIAPMIEAWMRTL